MRTIRETTAGALLAAIIATAVPALADGDRGFSGCLAVRGERVLAAENAERLFTPGSVQKLLVAAAALHHLGPDYRVATALVGGGQVRGGVLGGDLVVVAAGDPTWNERFFEDDPRAPLRSLARQLRRRGIRRVAGGLVVDASRFPGRSWPLSRPLGELAYAYAAPTSALAVDESSVEVRIAAGRRVGDPGTLEPLGTAAAFEWVNRIVTAPAERHEKGTVDFFPAWQGRTVVVRGEYPVTEPPYRVRLSVPHPDLFAAEILHRVLEEEGIAVAGSVGIATRPRRTPGATLAEIRSPPLAEILEPILRDSHNWYAEMLLRLLAAEVRGAGRDDEGLALVERFLVEEVGLAEGSFVLDDASGLSPYDLLSPEAAVGLLRYVRRQPWHGVFVAALARPGHGTLRGWRRLPPALAAKTGTLRQAQALAGYLAPSSPEPVIFACFLNHREEESGGLRAELAARLGRWAPR